MDTLLLALNTGDLTVDAAGSIAKATNGYAIAQDVASQLRLFAGELYYDTSQGIPYFEQILGHRPPAQLVKQYFVAAALLVPEVATAQCFLTSFSLVTRQLIGQVQVTTTAGDTFVLSGNLASQDPFA